MIMRIPGVGSQYLMAVLDAEGEILRRREDLQGDAAQGHPGRGLLVVDALRQPDPLDAADAAEDIPRAGSQNYPSPAAEAAADGSTTVWFGPEQPEGVARGNWIQTDPAKGWFNILRLYGPMPSFFDKSWRPSEIELVQ